MKRLATLAACAVAGYALYAIGSTGAHAHDIATGLAFPLAVFALLSLVKP